MQFPKQVNCKGKKGVAGRRKKETEETNQLNAIFGSYLDSDLNHPNTTYTDTYIVYVYIYIYDKLGKLNTSWIV